MGLYALISTKVCHSNYFCDIYESIPVQISSVDFISFSNEKQHVKPKQFYRAKALVSGGRCITV